MKALKYASVFSFPLAIYFSFTLSGWLTFLPLIYAFVFIPIMEQVIKGSSSNLNRLESEILKEDKIYDFLLYLISLTYLGQLFWFLFAIQEPGLTGLEITGRILSMGLLIGVCCINVAHELGHRHEKFDRFLSQVLLWSTQYTHFYIEHNQGHHKNVSTQEDPASARKGEVLYFFWLRSIVFSYLSAWKIELKNLERKKKGFFSRHNNMLFYTLLQAALIFCIYWFFGTSVLVYYVLASLIGIVFLETINYIEHYGLARKRVNEFRYENTMPWHSWNSNHFLGRMLLFELTRHSDHHYEPSKKYQILDSHEKAPTLPLGYPGSMLLSMLPPLWFFVMHREIKKIPQS
ncbi:MAG: alkane 1-monooxygenase [Bacteroidota bacterium]